MPSQFRVPLRILAGTALLLGFIQAAEAAEFKVELNEQKALHLSAPAATVMIGNPTIADVRVENAQTVYVLGRSYGKTNFIALDAAGKQIASFDLAVVAPSSGVVTLMRGTGQSTYSCSPRCEPTVNPSDDAAAFNAALGQGSATANAAGGIAVSAGNEHPN